MSTKVKIFISILAICLIVALIAVSLVLVFTNPAHPVESSTMTIEYTAGKVYANVDIRREDVKLYHSESEGDSLMTDVGAEYAFKSDNTSTSSTSEVYDLGMFNSGQFIDITQADTTLVIDVELSSEMLSSDTYVQLTYVDTHEKDINVKLVVTATMYRTRTPQELSLGETTYTLDNGAWDMDDNTIFRANDALSSKYGDYYTGVRIVCKAQVVSYLEDVRLDGQFKLSLIAKN